MRDTKTRKGDKMPLEKAAMFIDNSNIFKGTKAFSKHLVKNGKLFEGQYLSILWPKLLEMLESQDDGLDIYARHFFGSLPPASDVSRLKRRPTEQEWDKLIKESAQTGFYRAIQEPPLNFTLHGVPLRFAVVKCRTRMRQAYYKCLNASGGELKCKLSLDPNQCYRCGKEFLYKYEKGVDVALASELVIFCGTGAKDLNRVILVAGDGDYREAIRFVRRDIGKEVQVVSWRVALSKELGKIANKPTILIDDYWRDLCEIREKPSLDEIPAADEEATEEGE
jgi:uncharacterized LabA/DUF88 family protein